MNGWALARRDLRGGIGGLWLLLVCLTIAVAGLAAVTSLASSIRSAIAENSRGLLGGDLMLSTAQRSATPQEQAAMARLGPVAESITTRANLVAPGGSALVELSGVGGGWPPAGRVEFVSGRMPGPGEAAVGREVADRFRLRLGAPVRIGFAELRVSGVIRQLPAVSGFALAPPVLVSREGLEATRLVQPGSLYSSGYRILLPDGADGTEVGAAFQRHFPDGGWRVVDKADAAGGTRRFVDNVGQLLLLIALGALGIGSIGVASAISAFAASRRNSIAVLKIVGARRGDLALMLGLAVALLAGLAILLGLAVGAATPSLVSRFTGDLLPIQPDPSPQWRALGVSALFGLLIVLAAAWRPLARAVEERPAAVLRGDSAGAGSGRAWRSLLVPSVAALGAMVLALATSTNLELTGYALLAAAVLTATFALIGWLVKRGARLAAGRGGPVTRLGIAALHRPGSATVRLSIALGLGLSLLVALSAIGTSLSSELKGTVPQKAPALFMLDIPAAEQGRFRTLAERMLPGSELRVVPSLRGPVTAVNGQPVSAMTAIPEGAWILRGDRGLTFAGALPPGNRVVSGEWWPADYRGPPLMSLDVEAGKALNLDVGDTITVAVLGRPIEARIASFREIDWRSFGFNFAIIFAPGALENAPYTLMATIAPGPDRSTSVFERALSAELPMVSSIRVAEVVERIQTVLDAMDAAIRLATGLAILIGVAVLAGAVAATRASRARESVLLKLVGATRRQVLTAQLIEFGAMSGAIAFAAFLLGTAAGWAVVDRWFKLPFHPDWARLVALPLAGIGVAVATSLVTAWPALRARPAEALRSL